MGSSPAGSTSAPVAQWSEQLTHNQLVVGSSPTRRTQNTYDMQHKISPYVIPGLGYQQLTWLRDRTCFITGEMDIIATSVCNEVGISLDDLRSDRRFAKITEARKIFSHISKRLYMYTNRTLGEYINKNHSTIVVATSRCDDYMQTDLQFKELYKRCLSKVINNLNANGYYNYKGGYKDLAEASEVKLLNKIENGFECKGALAHRGEQA